MTAGQLLLGFAIALLWLWLITSWRTRNWRAVCLGIVGTIAMLIAGVLPNPAQALARGAIWLITTWVFLFRPDLVGVISRQEYDYIDAYSSILRRIGERKRSSRRPDAEASLQAFESDVKAMRALKAPFAWSRVQADTVRELERRLTVMKARTLRSPEDLKPFDDRWRDVGQLFRDTLKARAGFWTGWPHLFRRYDT